MSGGEDVCPNDDYNNVLAKHDEAKRLEVELNSLNEKLLDIEESIKTTFAAAKNEKSEMDVKMNLLRTDLTMLEDWKKLSIEVLNNVVATYDEKVQKQTTFLGRHKAEFHAKLKELAPVQLEFESLQSNLERKKDIIAELQKEVEAETCLLEEQKKTLSDLISTSESKAKQSKHETEKLNEIISSEEAENAAIRKEISKLSEELAAMDAQCRSTLADVAALQSIVDDNEATYEQEETKNHKIMSELTTTEQKQDEEIIRSEQQLSECRTKYENMKKADDELNDQIYSDIGSSGSSLEEMCLQAKRYLDELNIQCSELNNSIGAANDKKFSNENMMTQMKKEMDDLSSAPVRNVPTKNRESKQPNRPNQTERHQEKEHIFPRPPNVRSNVNTTGTTRKRRLTQQEQVQEQNSPIVPIVQIADSSVSDLSLSLSEIPAQEDHEESRRRHFRALELFKKHFF